MIRNTQCKFYYITSSLDQVKIKNIKKFRNIGVIYKQENNKSVDICECYNLKNICKKNQIPFFISDDFKLANKLDANGVFLTSLYKKPVNSSILKKNFKILGAVHSQLEYFLRARQQCEIVVFSPLFYNEKYSLNKILSVIKFNLITLNWRKKISAMGGIKYENVKKIQITNCDSISFIKFLEDFKIKKPFYLKCKRAFKCI
jgi:thiamine-phosphate pyrophosphorylase